MPPLPVFYANTLLTNLIALGTGEATISILEKVARPVLVYLILVFALRKFGKRILAQLNPFDLVVLLTLSNTVQNAIIGNDTSLLGGIIGAAALLIVNWVIVRIYYRAPHVGPTHGILEEGDIFLIKDFVIQKDALRKLHINLGELTARAHERGFDDIHEVETAVLYPNGTIYMKGDSRDSARIEKILHEVQSLRQELAARPQ